MTGIIGVGLLGSAIARRLMAHGEAVMGWDPDPRPAAGLRLAESNVAVVRECRRVIFCLPHSGVTAGVLDEVAPALAAGTLLIDMTTGDPEQMASFGRRAAGLGCGYVDATVVGSSRQVEAGEGVILAGGEDAHLEAAKDLFALLASRLFHTGPCGSGARLKLVVNLVLGLNRAVLAEGLAFAERCGIDGGLALEILKATPAYSRVMDVKGPKMLAREYAPEARLRQHHKDVRLILAEAGRRRGRVPLSELHDRILGEAEAAGFADADNSAVIEVLRRLPVTSTEGPSSDPDSHR